MAHAVAKSALFAGAGVIGSAYRTDDLEGLRGVAALVLALIHLGEAASVPGPAASPATVAGAGDRA